MIIDCHTHLGCPGHPVAADEHQQAMQDVDGCFVLAPLEEDRGRANQILSDYVKQHSNRVGFAVLNPVEDRIQKKDIKSLTVDAGLKGIVLYCSQMHIHPAHSRALRLYEQCQNLGLIVFFHNGPPLSPNAFLEYSQPVLLDEIARTFPGMKMIVGRMGVPFIEQTTCLLAKHENVFSDLTITPQKMWHVYNLVLTAYESGVMDKLLFGSGYPYAKPDVCIETLLGFNKLLSDANLPQVPREKLRSVVERDTLSLMGLT